MRVPARDEGHLQRHGRCFPLLRGWTLGIIRLHANRHIRSVPFGHAGWLRLSAGRGTMKIRALGAAAGVTVTVCALWGCATQQVMLEMRRDVILRPPNINEITVDPTGRVDTRGQASTVKVTMTGDPELKATFDLKGRAQDLAMQETEPGVYVGSFDVKPNETGKLDIVGH